MPVPGCRRDLSVLVQDCIYKLPIEHRAMLCSGVREQAGSEAKQGSG